MPRRQGTQAGERASRSRQGRGRNRRVLRNDDGYYDLDVVERVHTILDRYFKHEIETPEGEYFAQIIGMILTKRNMGMV